ncbi:hypothetical protein [Chlamydia buteonis]|uniref:Inner membrane protein n=1 Tax=Chlamydia buteonis TaxID=2494525 RepID=A0ABX8LB86_9CHLA|nr:hypothetical protein [Chlamydia buteonis]QXE27122.1 hypothetical protein HBN95_03155 [Chlamydia buteonis]QXE27953.1 hypothetical protein JJJ19_05045 [Chlamydia buteonis]
MTSNKNHLLICLPGILWLSGGIKLLLKASTIVYQPDLSFKILILLAMGAWFVASLKYRFLLLKSVSSQNDLSNQLLLGSISKKVYLRKSFFSKRFLVMATMIVVSLLLRRCIDNPAILFFIRSTIGYALIKTALTYFAKSPKNQLESL